MGRRLSKKGAGAMKAGRERKHKGRRGKPEEGSKMTRYQARIRKGILRVHEGGMEEGTSWVVHEGGMEEGTSWVAHEGGMEEGTSWVARRALLTRVLTK